MSPQCVPFDRQSKVLFVDGELDIATVDELREHLADTTITTLDMAGVTFIDVVVLSALVTAHRARAARGGLRLRAPSTSVRRLLRLSGLEGHLPIDPP